MNNARATGRSTGAPTAGHLAREALAVIIRLAGQAPRWFRPISSSVAITTMRTRLSHLFPALGLVCLVLTQGALAQGLPSLQELRKRTDATMEQVGKGNIEAGLKAIRPLTIIPTAEFDSMLGQVSLQLPAIKSRFGESIGYEFIKEETLGASLARITYIHRFDKHAMRWMFYAYKGKSGWVLNTFRFDDKWHELLPGQ